MDVVVLATKNRGKAREIQAMLEGIVTRVESLADHPHVALPPEGSDSYRENALEKARAVWRSLGLPALGDDSGLEVEALDGAPGVTSARFAGPGADDAANNARLLAALRGLPPARRGATFRCVLALVEGEGRERVVEGVCPGTIVETPRGTEGFGYDPLFLPEGETRTYAELPHEVKNAVSHRGRAVRALRNVLATIALVPLALAGCSYAPPTWRHVVTNSMPQPHEHRFAVVVLSTQSRAPRGLAAFPDGGKEMVLRQTAKLWLCDPEAGRTRLMARIDRPRELRSEYSTWIVGWDSTGDYRSIYLDVRGREGETSDTKTLRWLLKVEVGPDTSRAIAIAFVPPTAGPPRGPGPLRGGRELQVSTGDTMSVRTDTDPEWRPRFYIEPETGNVLPLSSDLPSGKPGA